MRANICATTAVSRPSTWWIVLWVCFALSPAPVAAASKLPALYQTLSAAKAEAVDRASKVRICSALRDSKEVANLVLTYSDARIAHNSKLEAWIVSLRSGASLPSDIAAETESLNTAFLKVRAFTKAADTALLRAGCPRKVLWQPLLVALVAVAVDKAYDYFKSASSSEAGRDSLIKELQAFMLPEWGSTGPFAAYDWSNEQYFASGEVSPYLFVKGSTSVYVNKWALIKKPNEYFRNDKELPAALRDSYFLYTGPIDSLKEFTGWEPAKK